MKSTIQWGVAGVIVVAAAGAVFATTDEESAVQDSMEGHDHAAMMAGMEQARPVALDDADARRIGVTFTTVETRPLERSVEAVGTATYDETGLRAVTPKVAGWVERLRVDFTGAPVRRGEPLLDLYSPELVTAQEELALAARLRRDASGERARTNAEALVRSARRRLAYWDIPEAEVRRIEDTGEIRRSLTLEAPASGIVVEKPVVEGSRVAAGDVLYRIADLSTIWIEADVFERDLALVEEGRQAAVRFEALPGETFSARVAYVHPTVSLEARTGRVRLELPNPRGELRPGMYARVAFDLPPTEALPLIPRSALLETGERSLVFVLGDDGTLEPRAVVAGRAAGREVQILQGLTPGERVVSSAAFLIDAESNLGSLGGSPDGTQGMDGTDHSQTDHSQHPATPPDTAGGGPGAHGGHGATGSGTSGKGSTGNGGGS
jgi:Cu(I)/Ag(I) efflux system membrane fusion protein